MVEMGSGRKPIFFDEFHRKAREVERDYIKRNREAWNLAAREHISVAEARKRLGLPPPTRQHGKRKKPKRKKK